MCIHLAIDNEDISIDKYRTSNSEKTHVIDDITRFVSLLHTDEEKPRGAPHIINYTCEIYEKKDVKYLNT